MITIRVNGKTGEHTIISADDTGAEKSLDALATIMAGWIFEKGGGVDERTDRAAGQYRP